MTSPLPLLRSFSTENQNRDWCKRFSLRVNRKAGTDGKLAGVTAFNLDDTTSNYSGTTSIRKKSFQIYGAAAPDELEPLNNGNHNGGGATPGASEPVWDSSRCWNQVKCLFNGIICSHKFKNVQVEMLYQRYFLRMNQSNTVHIVWLLLGLIFILALIHLVFTFILQQSLEGCHGYDGGVGGDGGDVGASDAWNSSSLLSSSMATLLLPPESSSPSSSLPTRLSPSIPGTDAQLPVDDKGGGGGGDLLPVSKDDSEGITRLVDR